MLFWITLVNKYITNMILWLISNFLISFINSVDIFSLYLSFDTHCNHDLFHLDTESISTVSMFKNTKIERLGNWDCWNNVNILLGYHERYQISIDIKKLEYIYRVISGVWNNFKKWWLLLWPLLGSIWKMAWTKRWFSILIMLIKFSIIVCFYINNHGFIKKKLMCFLINMMNQNIISINNNCKLLPWICCLINTSRINHVSIIFLYIFL